MLGGQKLNALRTIYFPEILFPSILELSLVRGGGLTNGSVFNIFSHHQDGGDYDHDQYDVKMMIMPPLNFRV